MDLELLMQILDCGKSRRKGQTETNNETISYDARTIILPPITGKNILLGLERIKYSCGK